MVEAFFMSQSRGNQNFVHQHHFFPHRFKDSQISIKNNDPYVIHENGTLEIHVAQPLNSGKYTCIATNNLGIKENHVYLEVKGQTRTSHHLVHFVANGVRRVYSSTSGAKVTGPLHYMYI